MSARTPTASTRLAAFVALVAFDLGAAPALARQAPADSAALTFEPLFEVVAHRVLEGRKRPDVLILFGRGGQIETWRPGAEKREGQRTPVMLPHPERTLVDTASYGGRDFVVAASPAGLSAYALDENGSVASEAQIWIPRAKFTLRVLAPQLSAIVQDVNRDGAPDIVLPTPSACELWLASVDSADGAPQFRKTATLAVDVTRWGAREGEFLSDALESSFAIPGLDTRDVNGDGRPDLLVEQEQRRAFHLQREDGTFPVAPDVHVDLSIFRDTTEAGGLKLGGVLSSSDRASWSSRDLDRDGIPDYVIGHRRKVWVFRGGKKGPQFKDPAAILKTAEDITVLTVLELDDDEHPDLLLVKVQVPTLATLLRGLFGEWDVRIGALGYRNKGDATFETNPKWSNELTVRLPGIVGLVKNPEKILERFTDLEKRFRLNSRGDVNGDGELDVLVASEDRKRLDVWFGARGTGRDTRGERKVREILFDDKNTTWDVDRVVAALGNFAQRQIALLTGERKPDWSVELRDPAKFELGALECADFDGDERAEVLVGYRRGLGGRAVLFDVLSRR
jgi:hypothetical protein